MRQCLKYNKTLLFVAISVNKEKLDRLGPVDNRPTTDKLNHFVQREEEEKEEEKM